MEKGRSHATVAGGKLIKLRLMVSAGMEKGRSHATAADECENGEGKEPCHGCWR